MKKSYIFGVAAMLTATLLTGCTDTTTMVSEETEQLVLTESDDAQTITVAFSRSSSATSRADDDSVTTYDEFQTDEEKAVSSIIAVIFDDNTSDVEDGSYSKSEEDNENDTFLDVIEIIGSNDTFDEGLSYTFTLAASNYQIVFIANAPDDVIETLNTFSSSATVGDFKELFVEQDPSTKPMPMTSSFYALNNSTKEVSLGTVTLVRIMSRIDIINLADGVTLDKAEFSNRSYASYLISDAKTFEEEFIDYPQTYTLNLAGNSDDTEGTADFEAETGDVVNACKATIYSYEQYSTVDDGYIPSITIYYHLDEDSEGTQYYCEVPFSETDDDGDETPIYLMRNYLYRILVSYNEDEQTVTFTLKTLDWENALEMQISHDEIGDGITEQHECEFEGIAVGDFIMSDGDWVSASDMETNASSTYKETGTTYGASAIAIVWYVGTDRVGSGAQEAVTTSTGTDGYVHGLAIALKNAGTSMKWSTEAIDIEGLTNIENGLLLYEDYDGYTNTGVIKALSTYSSTKYPPVYYAADYWKTKVSAPSNTSGWYLPSIGEWMDILKNLGELDLSEYFVESYTEQILIYYSGSSGSYQCDTADNINDKMSVVGSGNYTAISYGSTTTRNSFYVSSEISATQLCRVYFNAEFISIETNPATAKTKRTKEPYAVARAVLAF